MRWRMKDWVYAWIGVFLLMGSAWLMVAALAYIIYRLTGTP